jgi:hypothetical protein
MLNIDDLDFKENLLKIAAKDKTLGGTKPPESVEECVAKILNGYVWNSIEEEWIRT